MDARLVFKAACIQADLVDSGFPTQFSRPRASSNRHEYNEMSRHCGARTTSACVKKGMRGRKPRFILSHCCFVCAQLT